MKRYLSVTQADGSKWGVPVDMIARDRAAHYMSEFGDDIKRSLAEDTLPLFETDDYEIQDWAVNNMNWSDFDGHQIRLADAEPLDFQDAWMNGDKEVVDVPVASGRYASVGQHGSTPTE